MPRTDRVVQRRVMPAALRPHDVLPSDYWDLFALSSTDLPAATAEEWARAAIEGAPAAGRFAAWRVLCALRLDDEPTTPSIGGWRVVAVDEQVIRVEARSWFMTANMVFLVAEHEVLFATLIRYDHPVGRGIWTPVSAVHRRVAPQFLGGAAARLRRGLGTSPDPR